MKAAKEDGPGHNYLIQHSAGSGKSNSISWLAYELSGLTRPDGDALFDSVIVLTDRVTLDNQLQSNILAMEQTPGVVQSVTHGSKELLDQLMISGENDSLDIRGSLPDRLLSFVFTILDLNEALNDFQQ